ncbi:MAG: PAS domain-containing sensor histidine kinase, partial [Gemmatimonadetes bacterium]|nr:PAS domain-containing sensor histidine kinase [Gemmatimonadota bacterium]
MHAQELSLASPTGTRSSAQGNTTGSDPAASVAPHGDPLLRQAAILTQITEGVIVADRDGRIAFVNDAARRIQGQAVLGVPVEGYSQTYHLYTMGGEPYAPEDLPLARAVRDGEMIECAEWRIRRADGTEVIAEGSATPLFDPAGEQIGAVLTVRDVTERHLLRQQLEIERARLREVVMSAPAFVAVARGPDHVFELANPPYYQLVGHRDLIGRPVREALPEVVEQGFIELLDEVYRTGEPFVGTEMRILLQRKQGGAPSEHFVTFVYLPLRESDGSISGLLAHGVDVTDQVRARQRIEDLYHEAERASQAKSDFLAVMSHELRTPLNAIMGFGDLLLAGIYGDLSDRQEDQVERIQASSRHLTQIIDEILTFTRAEAGTTEVRPEEVDVRQVAEETLAEVASTAKAKRVGLRLETPAAPVVVQTDRMKLRQILLHLVTNAVKFTKEGEVSVAVRTDEGGASVEVRDTGIGIAPEDLERIFEPFTQADQGLTRAYEGTGLGLAVSRQLAELLGGEIAVESEPER